MLPDSHLTREQALEKARGGQPVEAALRIPVRDPDGVLIGRWMYVRAWHNLDVAGWRERTFQTLSGGLGVSKAARFAGEDRVPWMFSNIMGLPHKDTPCPGVNDLDALASALDVYLLGDMGAEPVPEGEWPAGCTGEGYHPDYPPFEAFDYICDTYPTMEQQRVEYARWREFSRNS